MTDGLVGFSGVLEESAGEPSGVEGPFASVFAQYIEVKNTRVLKSSECSRYKKIQYFPCYYETKQVR